jgi:hypothetical protein
MPEVQPRSHRGITRGSKLMVADGALKSDQLADGLVISAA